MERELIRERIKLGLARRKQQGKKLGRQFGAKDKARRKRLGYFVRYSNKNKLPPNFSEQVNPITLNTNKE